MPRLFLLSLFDENFSGALLTWKSADHLAPLLGDADQLGFYFRLTNGAGSTPTITATYFHSNDGKYYTQHTVLLNNQAFSTPYDTYVTLNSAIPLGAFGQLRIYLNSGLGTPAAFIHVLACGRTGRNPS